MNILHRPNVSLFDTDLKLPLSAFPPLQLTTPNALWDRNLGLIFIFLLLGERKKIPMSIYIMVLIKLRALSLVCKELATSQWVDFYVNACSVGTVT